MNRLKVVQIGTGHDHAPMAIHSLRKQNDVFEVLGYAEPEGYTPNAEYDGLTRYSVEEALSLPGLEAAVIETSEKGLTKYAAMAADKGLAVYMDKPGGDVPAEFDALIDKINEKGIVFSTGYMYRYNPAINELLKMIEEGKLGEILHVEAQMNCRHNADKRAWLSRYKGGMMFFLGCHLIDLIIKLQGMPEEIIPYNHASYMDGNTSEDCGLALLRYKNGISFAKTTAVEIGGFMRRQLIVVGTKGTVEINPLEYYAGEQVEELCTNMYVTLEDDMQRKWWRARGEKQVFGPYNRYDAMMKGFADAARGDNKLPTPEYERMIYHAAMRASGIE